MTSLSTVIRHADEVQIDRNSLCFLEENWITMIRSVCGDFIEHHADEVQAGVLDG